MFNNNQNTDTKIAVLEERLSSYEVMINKIDEAIQIMGKTSQSISKMLAVHDERIDQCTKTDSMIFNLINDLKKENKEQHDSVSKTISKFETKLEEVIKFRWILIGICTVVTLGLSQSSVVVDLLTPDNPPVKVVGHK